MAIGKGFSCWFNRMVLVLVVVVGVMWPLQVQGSHSQVSSSHIPFADESFRRLESGENSEEMVNQCCKREPQFVPIGYGADGTQLRVDVGTCRQVCNKVPMRPLKRDEFDRYLKKYPSMDPIQIFLALQSRVAPTNVTSSLSLEDLDVSVADTPLPAPIQPGSSSSTSSCIDGTCRPSSTRRERHFGVGGGGGGMQHEVEVVETCDCVQLPDSCTRLARPIRIHLDTPFETVVDMGECSGPCDSPGTSSCRPIRNRTISVEGPNGVECLQVIEECSCTGDCFRVKEFFKVFDFSNVLQPNQNDTNSSLSESLNENLISRSVITSTSTPATPTEPLTKVIDVGRCEGSCGGKQGHSATSKCLIWSSPSRTSCLSSLYGGHPSCAPTKLHTHSYTDRKGVKHSLYSVISCGCH